MNTKFGIAWAKLMILITFLLLCPCESNPVSSTCRTRLVELNGRRQLSITFLLLLIPHFPVVANSKRQHVAQSRLAEVLTI